MSNFIQNVLLGISLAAPVGPVTMVVLKHGIKGFSAAFFATIGVALSDLVTILIIYFGLSYFIDVPWVEISIMIFGTFVLIYLGSQSIKDFFSKKSLQTAEKTMKKNPILETFFTGMSNPMSRIWWLGIFGPILALGSSRYIILLDGVMIAFGEFLFFFILSVLLHWGRRHINETAIRYTALIAGIFLVGFGIKLGYTAFLKF